MNAAQKTLLASLLRLAVPTVLSATQRLARTAPLSFSSRLQGGAFSLRISGLLDIEFGTANRLNREEVASVHAFIDHPRRCTRTGWQ